MNVGDNEYNKLRDEFMKEQYAANPQKPNAMVGSRGWFAVKEKEFQDKLRQQGKLND